MSGQAGQHSPPTGKALREMTISTKHPDHARIIEGVAATEAQITSDDLAATDHQTAHAAVNRLVGQLADPDSVRAVARLRTSDVLDFYPEMLLISPSATLRSVWMDGFTAGVRFQQAGGHVEA